MTKKIVIRWENGLGGSGGSKRIFWGTNARIGSKKIKKIRLDPPDPPNPFSHRITTFFVMYGDFSTKKNQKSNEAISGKSFFPNWYRPLV
jgi:hypothetical protein